MIVCLRAQAVNVCLIYDDSNRFLFLKHARAETRSVKMNINPSPAPSGDSGLCTRGGGRGTCKKNDWGRKSCSNADSKYRMWPSASKEHIFLRLRSTDNVRGMLQPLWLMKKKHIWVFSVFFFLQLSEETPQTLKMHLVKFKAVPTPSNPPFCQTAQTSTGKRVQIQKNLIIHFKIFDSGLFFFFCFGSKSNTSLGPFFLTLQFFSHVIYL